MIELELYAVDGQGLFVFGDRLGWEVIGRRGSAPPAARAASCSFLLFSCAMILMPAGNAARPLTWSPSLCVRMTVVTGLGVILAISSRSSWPPALVVFGVDYDDAVVADDDGAVAASAFDPVDVGLELMGDEGGCRPRVVLARWRGGGAGRLPSARLVVRNCLRFILVRSPMPEIKKVF